MKKQPLLALVIFGLSHAIHSAGWKFINMTADSGFWYVDTTSISVSYFPSAKYISGWTKTVYTHPVFDIQKQQIDNQKVKFSIDCTGKRKATVASSEYLNGQLVSSFQQGPTLISTYADIIPESIGDAMYTGLCPNYK